MKEKEDVKRLYAEGELGVIKLLLRKAADEIEEITRDKDRYVTREDMSYAVTHIIDMLYSRIEQLIKIIKR